MLTREKLISIIIPVRNEKNYIRKCIESLLSQTYPHDLMEILFVDGMSEDMTKHIILECITNTDLNVKIFENKKRIAPVAMNIGIKNANGNIIIRLDAHSSYAKNYIELCVDTLEKTKADNVGGVLTTIGKGAIGESYAKVLSSKFGVGNSGFRTNARSGYTDTVPFGAYNKETFEKYGLYDERLVRNQDYELNYRIRKNGGKIYLNSDIQLTYYCRDTIDAIIKQSYENGKWNYVTMKLCPGSMGIRHFIPFIFFISLIVMPLLSFFSIWFAYLFILELIAYFLLDLLYSINCNIKCAVYTAIFYPIFHISYGFGTFRGLTNIK